LSPVTENKKPGSVLVPTTKSSGSKAHPPNNRAPIAILGVPFDNLSMDEAVESIAAMIHSRRPHYVATANVDFVVQVQEDIELRRILFDAHMVLCDGMPLVWASKKLGNPLKERVTGSDLVPRLLVESEVRGWRVFFLGGTSESVEAAASNTLKAHPKLNLVGAYSPPFKTLLEMNHDDIIQRIHASKPDLLLVAFGCPKQEKWINMHYQELGVPVSIGVGATLDFLAGTFKRAPIWMQRIGMEWLFRLLQEPKRLARRYGNGFWVFGRAILRQAREMRHRPPSPATTNATPLPSSACIVPNDRSLAVLKAPHQLDAAAAPRLITSWLETMSERPVVLDLSETRFIDSTGVGLLVRLRKRSRDAAMPLVLAAPGKELLSALRLMNLTTFFETSRDVESARKHAASSSAPTDVVAASAAQFLRWRGEVTATTLHQISESSESCLESFGKGADITIDLREVTFVDSSGVGLMLRLKKRAWQRGVSVVYINPSAPVSNVLKLTRLEEFLLRKNQ
jgi:N-acetylglucosaminyldiphosphoundecaprenol N-acetyl-beta-D-mannosaminyltransferase